MMMSCGGARIKHNRTYTALDACKVEFKLNHQPLYFSLSIVVQTKNQSIIQPPTSLF